MARIVIQAGHYPRTSGATGTGGRDGDPTEQEFNIAAARACARRLAEVGHQGVVINADVPDASYRGDAFVAIHCDGSTSSSARGASVGYRTAEGQAFAGAFKRAYQAAGWSGGWRPDNYTAALAGYYGTKRAVAQGVRRAFVAEAGFLTNPADEAQLSLPGGPDRFARALTAAVVATFGVPHQEDDFDMTPAERTKLIDDIAKKVHQRLDAEGFDPATARGSVIRKATVGLVAQGIDAQLEEDGELHARLARLEAKIDALAGPDASPTV